MHQGWEGFKVSQPPHLRNFKMIKLSPFSPEGRGSDAHGKGRDDVEAKE
jgi:hypothetical protein